MTTFKKILLLAACVGALSFTTGKAQAQGRGGFDPAQMRDNILNFYKDKMSVTNDDEWKVLSDAIGKVVDARREQMDGERAVMRAMFRGGRNRSGDNNNGDNNGGNNNRRNRGNNGPGGNGPQMSPEAEDLQKAIDDKAPKDEINAKLAKLRESNAAKEAKVVAAQDDLKKLLTSRQEAVAVLYGLLK